jgi:hypothetical protein
MYGTGDVRVETVPDARLLQPTDALVRSPTLPSVAATCGRTTDGALKWLPPVTDEEHDRLSENLNAIRCINEVLPEKNP